jgi:hypothetical protein
MTILRTATLPLLFMPAVIEKARRVHATEYENGVKDATARGKGKGHAAVNDGVSDEDEYLIKTDHLVKTGF